MTQRLLAYTITDPDKPGGVEAVFQGVIAACRKAGMITKALRAHNCSLFVRDDPERRIHIWSLLRLAWQLVQFRPTVVNVHFVTAETLYFAVLKPVFRYRLVLSFHGSDLLLPDDKTADLLPRILSRADVVTVVSGHMVGRLRELAAVPMERVETVFNGIDPAFWQPDGMPDNAGTSLLCAGRLEPVKGFDLLITAFARIIQDRPDLKLVIAGEGAERATLEQQAHDAGIADHVTFAGFLDRAGLRAAYRDAHLFVMPSRSEGFPIALLEAMATGLPFVAADVGGVGEIATPQTGVCVPPEDTGALAAALVTVCDTWDLKAAGRAARSRASAFSVAQSQARYVRLLDAKN